MFIREITKRNPLYKRTFTYHRLMESVRTARGPRQRVLLNLGRLEIPASEWKMLANRIEEVVLGRTPLLPPPAHIESLAQHYAGMLRQKEMQSVPPPEEAVWERVNLVSQSHGESRTIGAEAVGYQAFQRLGFPEMLVELGFRKEQIHQAALLIIGRLVHPGSDRETAYWGKHLSALGELLEADYQHLSNNALYRLSDALVKHQDRIEDLLAQKERGSLGLKEKILLFDLTNTYLEGTGEESTKAHHGRSKEKRKDCPLLTLALVIDEDGFPKKSQVLPGNADEPGSLEAFLEAYETDLRQRMPLFKDLPTVVVDAGVGTSENLKLIRGKGFHYITVKRGRPSEAPQEGLAVIKEDRDNTVKAKRLKRGEEVILYCESSGRARKEAAMKARFQKHFEEGLQEIAGSLTKTGGHKGYGKTMERLGRLKEKYPSIARFYEVQVQEEKGRATHIQWSVDSDKELEARFSGAYYIRSSRTDLDEKELWSLYTMLTEVEDAFRCLKSELGLRPVFHRIDRRQEGHLFITVLAYHLLAIIQRQLKAKGISHRWDTIRKHMASHTRVTNSVTTETGERVYIRQTGDPEPFHLRIYHALGLPPKPLKAKRMARL